MMASAPPRAVKLARIIAEALNITFAELLEHDRRAPRIVRAREAIAGILHEAPWHFTYPEIAAACGRRQHSTYHMADRRWQSRTPEEREQVLRRLPNLDEALEAWETAA